MTGQERQRYEFRLSPEESGERLDTYLAGRNIFASRSRIKKMIEEGLIEVNGVKAKAGYKLKAGDCVVLREAEPAESCMLAEDIPLEIEYEDADILVVNKPAGMVVHPAAGNYSKTLVNALLHHCRDLSAIGGVLRPGIVHRLDKDTSGLLVVAKSQEALNSLQKEFREHRVTKIYEAIVFGDMPEEAGVIDAEIGRHPTDRKKMSTISKHGKQAVTRWRVLERYGIISHIEVQIETGRTHQIRVHLNSIGHPVLGDNVYGNASRKLQNISDQMLRSQLKSLKRQALHACRLGFAHPVRHTLLEFSSPLPGDMRKVLEFTRISMQKRYGEQEGTEEKKQNKF